MLCFPAIYPTAPEAQAKLMEGHVGENPVQTEYYMLAAAQPGVQVHRKWAKLF